MILVSASRRILQAYKIEPHTTTPVILTSDWFRLWRVDARRIGRKELTFFTNAETLYTIVIDSSKVRTVEELGDRFIEKYALLFRGRYGYTQRIVEEIVIHKAVDRSLVAVMNSFFLMAESHERDIEHEDLESWINDIPVIARNLIPAVSLAIHLEKDGGGRSNPLR